ncbi:dienelactone hydrolase [Protomyces lactucae-debilis]|uniref:Dienelactone hydrolase n=1 Tax=Protomyces lactucae-debilis TaxID=2754530 RepID=A0A1Y2F7S1_PROLT|nr:dienelactone hydrolase [Protomyces lactucae-debilis]ORY79524.1 dienelactone hydrolase [Protomyces lactucae-debilis]
MSANTNKACCTLPPVQSDYTPKGSYETLGDLKTYITGNQKSNKVLTVIYDIFGFHPATQQGADLLAESLDALVVMPDFFHGKPVPQELYPPQTDEDKQKIQDFFAGPAEPSKNLKALSTFAKAASERFPANEGESKKHAILGFCWGGKIAILASDKRDVFKATAVVHPAMLDAKDAKSLTNPIMILASKDEEAKDVKAFEEGIPEGQKEQSVVKTYSDMHHGWAAARANLKDEQNKKRFHEAYTELAEFFSKLL